MNTHIISVCFAVPLFHLPDPYDIQIVVLSDWAFVCRILYGVFIIQ